MAFPEAWGYSPQRGTDRCRDDIHNVTPRAGYTFTVQFDPNPAYSNAEWRAYKTNDLPTGNEWYISTAAITNTLKDLVPLSKDELTIDHINGGRTSITIHGKDPITLIPWSELQPRIIMSSPERGSIVDRTPNRDITVTFASAVAFETLIYREGHIEITGKLANPGMTNPPSGFTGKAIPMESYFAAPLYNEGNHTLTIQSKGAIPVGLIIDIKLGENIKSPGGDRGLKETVLQYRTVLTENIIDSWKALYNEVNERIEIYWELPPNTDNNTTVIRYRENNSDFRTLILEESVTSFTIDAVKPNDKNVRDGIASSGFNSYTITLTLDEEPTQIVIWNVPGMELRQNWKSELDNINNITLTEISTADELKLLSENVNSGNNLSLNKVYVLTRSIVLNNWVPIGTTEQPFQGKFYGNGHTVTIRSINAVSDIGLFGVAGNTTPDTDNTIIRDLTVLYETTNGESVTINPETAFRFGGIVGRTQGNARLENVLVNGAVTLGGSGFTADIGGITGLLGRLTSVVARSTASIYNAYSSLNLTVDTNPGNPNFLFVGGIAGSIGRMGDIINVQNVSIIGDISVGTNGAVDVVTIGLNQLQGLFLGGLAGYIQGIIGQPTELRNSDYSQGIITLISGTGPVYIGGAVGSSFTSTIFTNCFSMQSGFNIHKYGDGFFIVGGFIGSANITSGATRVYMEHCYTEGPVVVYTDTNVPMLSAGGFAGSLTGNISYCYAKGDVSVVGYGHTIAGGFIAQSGGALLTNTYATGNVSVINFGTTTTNNLQNIGTDSTIVAGGLIGLNTGNIQNSYAFGDVFADKPNGDGSVFAGGLIGVTNNITENCFATGNVITQRASSNSDTTENIQRAIYTGALIGRKTGNTNAQNNAALGTHVTANGPGIINIGRIFGNRIDGGTISNHAFNGMQFRLSSAYGAGSVIPTIPSSTDAASNNGADAHLGTFRYRSFWADLGFSESTWDFSTVEARGYPVLRSSPNGQRMPGQ